MILPELGTIELSSDALQVSGRLKSLVPTVPTPFLLYHNARSKITCKRSCSNVGLWPEGLSTTKKYSSPSQIALISKHFMLYNLYVFRSLSLV